MLYEIYTSKIITWYIVFLQFIKFQLCSHCCVLTIYIDFPTVYERLQKGVEPHPTIGGEWLTNWKRTMFTLPADFRPKKSQCFGGSIQRLRLDVLQADQVWLHTLRVQWKNITRNGLIILLVVILLVIQKLFETHTPSENLGCYGKLIDTQLPFKDL